MKKNCISYYLSIPFGPERGYDPFTKERSYQRCKRNVISVALRVFNARSRRIFSFFVVETWTLFRLRENIMVPNFQNFSSCISFQIFFFRKITVKFKIAQLILFKPSSSGNLFLMYIHSQRTSL